MVIRSFPGGNTGGEKIERGAVPRGNPTGRCNSRMSTRLIFPFGAKNALREALVGRKGKKKRGKSRVARYESTRLKTEWKRFSEGRRILTLKKEGRNERSQTQHKLWNCTFSNVASG